jgi:hypothetical protein
MPPPAPAKAENLVKQANNRQNETDKLSGIAHDMYNTLLL